MQTRFELFDGVLLEVPDHPEFEWPVATFAGFPTCCGPGRNGTRSERLVPEGFLTLCWSPACWVHDFMYDYANRRDLPAFFYANAVLYRNSLAIIAAKGKTLNRQQLKAATLVANGYYDAVSTAGLPCFLAGKSPATGL